MAYENLAQRTNLESVKSVAQALIQAERYGTPVGQALRVLAAESRDQRMNEAEKKAAALPPKLTVPMILFFLPVLFGVILGPAGIQVMDNFSGRRAAVTRHLVLQIWMAWQSAAGNSVRRRFPHPIRADGSDTGTISWPALIKTNAQRSFHLPAKARSRGLMFLLQVSIRSEGARTPDPDQGWKRPRRTHGTGRTVGDRCLYQSEISWCSCGPNP
jgi:hypothetical protein